MSLEDLVLAGKGWGGVIIMALAGILAILYATSRFSKQDLKELLKVAWECKFRIGLVLIIGSIMMLSISWLIV